MTAIGRTILKSLPMVVNPLEWSVPGRGQWVPAADPAPFR